MLRKKLVNASTRMIHSGAVQTHIDKGHLQEAYKLFQDLPNPPSILCTNMLTAFSDTSTPFQAFHLFRIMLLQGIPPTPFLLVPLLKLCTNPQFLPHGKLLHRCVSENRLDEHIFVGNTLITMYRKCGTLHDATSYFHSMPDRNEISWNAIITAYAESGERQMALNLFHVMQLQGILPNRVTFLAVLGVIGVQSLHNLCKVILATGYATDSSISNSMLNAYCKNGWIQQARDVFNLTRDRNVITWTTMIDAYSEAGDSKETFRLFRMMLHDGGSIPNKITLLGLIKGCSHVYEARFLQCIITELGYEWNSVIGTNLIKMYARCGNITEAKTAFDKVPVRDAILWTSLITALTDTNHCREAVNCFIQMQTEGVTPDVVTYTSLLDICARSALASEGKMLHTSIIGSRIDIDLPLENSILNMYGRCGKLEDARELFNGMREGADILSWSIHIAAHAHHGYGQEALELFMEMQLEGIHIDYGAFVNMLSACRHAGLVTEGCDIFHRMVSDCGNAAEQEQYGCVIDLLARAGRLDDAERVLLGMPQLPGEVVWKAFLSSCKEHGDVGRARIAAAKLAEIVPRDTAVFVMLSNVLKEQVL